MPSGVSSKVRSQIRGLKNSKPSNDKSAKKANNALKKSVKKNIKAEANEEKMQSKASNKFAMGGPTKPVKRLEHKNAEDAKFDYENSKPKFIEKYAHPEDAYRHQRKNYDKRVHKRLLNTYGIDMDWGILKNPKIWNPKPFTSKQAIKKAVEINGMQKSKGGKLKSVCKKFKCGGKLSRKKC